LPLAPLPAKVRLLYPESNDPILRVATEPSRYSVRIICIQQMSQDINLLRCRSVAVDRLRQLSNTARTAAHIFDSRNRQLLHFEHDFSLRVPPLPDTKFVVLNSRLELRNGRHKLTMRVERGQ